MPNIFSVEALSRYGAKCPEFREAWHQVQCMIDVSRCGDHELASLIDHVIDMTEEEKRVKEAKRRG